MYFLIAGRLLCGEEAKTILGDKTMKATRILTGLLIGLIASLNAGIGMAQSPTGKGGGGDVGIKFKGTVESFPPGKVGDWRVGGRTIHVSPQCELAQEIGPVAVGAFVEIVGQVLSDGSMNATKIEVTSNPAGGDGRDDLKGAIESLPVGSGLSGDWQVAGHTVHVTASTIINTEHGAIALGALVEVTGTARSDNSIDAARIEVNPGATGDGEPVTVKGAIESMPAGTLIGDWIVNGSTVHVTSKTKLKGYYGGGFGVGVRVKVKGIRNADGSVDANKIQFAN
jgi:hypothetical protein